MEEAGHLLPHPQCYSMKIYRHVPGLTLELSGGGGSLMCLPTHISVYKFPDDYVS